MSDLDALYRAVLDRPDDDTPRLVYADALDDLGLADRAAFVRTQVEAARAAPWEAAAVRARVFGGDVPLGDDRRADLPELPDGLSWERAPFRRGFPAAVQARDGAAFVAAADRLFDLAPVESLELATTPAGDLAALAACAGLARLKRLVIRAGLGRATARVLLDSPHLGGLGELVVGASLTSASTAAAVVGSRVFRGLRSFSYRDEQRGGAMVAALTGLADPPPLRALDLQGNRLTSDGFAGLIGAPVARGLEALDLGDNHLEHDTYWVLLADGLPALRQLDLMRTGIDPPELGRFNRAPVTPRLRAINLSGNVLPALAGGVLGHLPLTDLRVLDLRDNRLGNDGVTRLVGPGRFGGLLHLDLAENGIGEAGAAALVAAPALDGILALDLGGNPIPPPSREALLERFGDHVLF